MSKSQTAGRIAALLEEYPDDIPFALGFLCGGATDADLIKLESVIREHAGVRRRLRSTLHTG